MPQWGNSDAASNSVIWAPAGLNKAPTRAEANTLYGNTSAGGYIAGRTDGMFAVDEDEVRAGAGGHAGWALKTTGSGGRAGRIQYETLVVQSKGFATDNDGDVVPNFLIIFSSQPPAAANVASGGNTSIAASVITQPAGKTVTYQWEANSGSGFANLSNAGLYSNVTTATLSISSANSTANQVSYRLVARGTGAVNTVSTATLLTVTA